MNGTLEGIDQEFMLIIMSMESDSCEARHDLCKIPCSGTLVSTLRCACSDSRPRKICQNATDFAHRSIESRQRWCMYCAELTADCWEVLPL